MDSGAGILYQQAEEGLVLVLGRVGRGFQLSSRWFSFSFLFFISMVFTTVNTVHGVGSGVQWFRGWIEHRTGGICGTLNKSGLLR